MSSFYMFSRWRRLIFLWIFVEERAPVHVGITDPVVAIDIQRAGIAPIVSIAQEDNAPEALLKILPASAQMRKRMQR